MKLFRFQPRFMNGVFAINKPSGVSSAQFLDRLQKVLTDSDVFAKDLEDAREAMRKNLSSDKKWSQTRIASKMRNLKIKMGHGGTLDPLASGVLIVGVGLGTKKLQYFLTQCRKTYETKALFGISTTTGDSEGEIIAKSPISHITREMVDLTPEKFIGNVKQVPPIFSALKMNGKPLYEYAREGIPIPHQIKERNIEIFDIKVIEKDTLSVDHEFEKLESELDEATGKPKESGLANNPTLNDSPLYYLEQYMAKNPDCKPPSGINMLPEGEELPAKLPLVHFVADVSSGTYIRSLISDFGRAVDLSAYMVELIRTRQSGWDLSKNVFNLEDFTERDERVWGVVLKQVFDQGDSIDVGASFAEIEAKLAPVFAREKELLKQKSSGTDKGDENQDEKEEILEKKGGVSLKEETNEGDIDKLKLDQYKEDSTVPKKRAIGEVE